MAKYLRLRILILNDRYQIVQVHLIKSFKYCPMSLKYLSFIVPLFLGDGIFTLHRKQKEKLEIQYEVFQKYPVSRDRINFQLVLFRYFYRKNKALR